MPPPPGAPAGGVWEGEPACGRKSLIVGLVFHCWCVAFCPIDTRPVRECVQWQNINQNHNFFNIIASRGFVG